MEPPTAQRRVPRRRRLVAAAIALVACVSFPAAAGADNWYKTDLHVHSSVSGDATDDIGIIAHAAQQLGYDALMLTDHTATSNNEIGGVVANNVTLDETDFPNWSSRGFGTVSSFTDAEASTPVNTGAKSLHLSASTGASAYGEQFRWYKRGPNLRSGDVILKFSVYPTRIDPGSGMYVSLSLGGDETITSRPPQGYTTAQGNVVSPGKHNVMVWQLGNPRSASSDPNARVTTHQLNYTPNQWNTYTINVTQAIQSDIPAADMPIDLNAITQLKMAAGGQGGTADGYFDTYSLKASTPVPSPNEFVYRNQHVSDFNTPNFTVFPSQEVGYSRHAMMFNFGITDPSQFTLYKQGIQSVTPVQQSGYPSQLNHPGLPGGVTQQEAIDTFGEGADLMEVAERSDEEGYIKNVMVDAWDGVLKQGVQLLGAWTSDMHRVERLGPATYVLAPSRSFNALMQSLYEGRTYVALNDFPGRAIFNLDGGPDPYTARYPTYVSPSQSLANAHFSISSGIQPGSRVIWTSNGQPFAVDSVDGPSYDAVKTVPLGGSFTYVRAELKNAAGIRVAMSQPIFFRDAPSLLPAGMTYNVTGVTTPDGKGYSKLLTQGITSQSWDSPNEKLTLGLTNPTGSLDAMRLTTGDLAPATVNVDGAPVTQAATRADFDAATGSSWWFDPTNSVMLLKAKQSGGTATADVTFTQGSDTTAPDRPTGLTAHSHGAERIDLSWDPSGSPDVRNYTVSRNGTPIALVPAGTTTYSDLELPAGSHFSYTVDASDAAENHSPPSDPAGATTDTITTSNLTPVADAYTDASQPTRNFGTLTTLRTDGDPVIRTYLRFDVSGLQGTIENATLRLFNNSSSNGWDVHSADNAWSETGINAGNAPAPSDTLYGSSNGGAAGTWSTADVKPLITGNGTVTFELDTISTTAASYQSRTGANAPQLVIDTSTHTNNPPTASNGTIAATADTPASWTPSVNDLDGDTLSCEVVTQPAHGTADVAPDCSGGTYTPASGFTGFDSFTYRATDSNGAHSAPATESVTVGSPDNPPIAVDRALTATQDTSANWTPSVSDPDAGDTIACSIDSQPAHGTATVQSDCSGGTYTPNPGYTGSDPFTYKATDNHGTDSVPANVNVTVVPPNHAPAAADRTMTTIQNKQGSWTPSVSDADAGDSATCRIVSQPANGTATVAPNCSGGTYTPSTNFSGSDPFTYAATDSHGAGSNTATVSASVNLPFSDDFESGNLNAWTTTRNLTAQSATVHAGSFAARGNTTAGLAYAKKMLPGTYSDLTLETWFRAQSAPTATATIMRLRTAGDAALVSLNTTTSLRLGLRNDVTAVGKTSSTALTPGQWYQLQLHVIVNGTSSTTDVYVNGNKLTDVSTSTASLGATPTGEIQIGDNNNVPGYDYAWDDVRAGAGNLATPPATNHAPTSSGASLTTNEDVQGSWTPSVADSDAGDTTTCSIVSQPAHGTATVQSDCSGGTYTPNGNYNGPDSFTYRATDNHGADSTPATVSAAVTPVNDAPSAGLRSFTTSEETQGSWTPSVADPDAGDTTTCSIVSQPSHGTATVQSDCSGGTYTPNGNYNGSDSFTYRATDNHGADSTPATVSATVTPVNDAPSANDRSMSTPRGAAGSWTPSVSDPDGDTLTCAIDSQPVHGTATVQSDCSGGTYTPAAGYTGPDSFTYRATDPSNAQSNAATVSVDVTVPNTPPTASDRSLTTNQDTAGPWTPSVNDADGDSLTCSIVSQPANGSASVASDCSSGSYTPSAGYSGSDSFTYRATDSHGAQSNTATVSANVVVPSLFSDGFESGNLSAWSSSKGLLVQSAIVNSGSFAARGQSTRGVNYAKKSLGGTYSDVVYRTYFRAQAAPTGSPTIMRLRTAGDGALVGLYLTSGLKLGMRNDVTAVSKSSTSGLQLNRWYQLELHAIVNGAASTIEVRVDGTKLNDVSTTTADLGTNPIGILQLGENASGPGYDFAYDDVSARRGAVGAGLTAALRRAPRCGPGSRVKLSGARRQRVGRTGRVEVTARSKVACRVTAVAVARRGKHRKKLVSRARHTALPAGRKGTLVIRFSAKARRVIRRELVHRKVSVLVFAGPGSTKRAVARRTIVVKR